MKSHRQITVEVDHGPQVKLEGLRLGEEVYDLMVQESPRNDCLWISFHRPGTDTLASEFAIQIRDGAMRFTRHLYRPDHDHDDTQYLCVATLKTDNTCWLSRVPAYGGSFKQMEIPFGSNTE